MVHKWGQHGQSTLFDIPGTADDGGPFLDVQYDSGSRDGPAASPLPETTQKERPGGAAGDLLQSHHREHPDILHHTVVRRMLGQRQESAAEDDGLGSLLPSQGDISSSCYRAKHIINNCLHPNHHLFQLLPSDHTKLAPTDSKTVFSSEQHSC